MCLKCFRSQVPRTPAVTPLLWLAALTSALVLLALLPTARAEPRGAAPKEVWTMKSEQASAFARLALKGLSREYPNKPGDVLNDSADLAPVRVRHPAFYGSFDWHSSVHGHWMLVRLLRRFPDLPERKDIRAALAANLTAKNLQ